MRSKWPKLVWPQKLDTSAGCGFVNVLIALKGHSSWTLFVVGEYLIIVLGHGFLISLLNILLVLIRSGAIIFIFIKNWRKLFQTHHVILLLNNSSVFGREDYHSIIFEMLHNTVI